MDEDRIWDVVIVGAGPAGLSAALMLGRARRRVLVIDAGEPRNRFAAQIHGALGIEGTPPAELLRRGRAECAQYGVEFEDGRAIDVVTAGGGVRIELAGGETRRSRALVVATGLADEVPDIPGLRERWGRSVLHCPYCHGWEVRDQRLGMLLADERGAHLAGLIPQWSGSVTIFGTVGDETVRTRLQARGAVLVDQPIAELRGPSGELASVVTADGAEHPIDALFVVAPPRPLDRFLANLSLDRAETPFGTYLALDATGRTSAPRVWAAGNVVDPSANVPLSIGTGSRVGAQVNAFLVGEDTDAAVAASPPIAPADFWEERYAGTEAIWSGAPNASVVDAVRSLSPGRALDLGCGEGGDAIWLAEQGWEVSAIDLSETAIARARRAASDAGLSADRVRFAVTDLERWAADEEYDLVTTAFLHSPVPFRREEILRRARDAVRPGGHLIVVSHGGAPRWAPDGHEHRFPTPQDELAVLGLPSPDWSIHRAELRERTITAPDGTASTIEDVIVLAQRT